MINPIHLQLSNIVMRKLIALLTGIFIFTSTFSQTWFDLGLKGGAGTSILINQNIWNDRDYNHRISPAHCFGIKAGINLSCIKPMEDRLPANPKPWTSPNNMVTINMSF